jgi:pilus assembly protein CpaF
MGMRQFRLMRTPTGPGDSLGDLSRQVAEALERERPDLLGYLVWTPERVEALTAVVDTLVQAAVVDPPELTALVRRSVLNQVTGLGPLDDWLLDDTVTEIMINRPDEMVVERDGQLHCVPSPFREESEVRALAQRLAARAGRSLTRETPMVDARLSDGSRIAAVIPPVSPHTVVAIRRALAHPPAASDLIAAGALTAAAWAYLVEAVRSRRNIVIAGGAGSGKTHLLRLLAAEIPANERVLTLEDVRELNLQKAHVVQLEGGRLSIHDLFLQALRLRPDRIIVGEVRGGEALDLIEAMGSGHPGSLATVHSPAPGSDTVYRLARAALRSGTPLSFDVLCSQIVRTVDLIVFLSRDGAGRRSVGQIDEIAPAGVRPAFIRREGQLVAMESIHGA